MSHQVHGGVIVGATSCHVPGPTGSNGPDGGESCNPPNAGRVRRRRRRFAPSFRPDNHVRDGALDLFDASTDAPNGVSRDRVQKQGDDDGSQKPEDVRSDIETRTGYVRRRQQHIGVNVQDGSRLPSPAAFAAERRGRR